MIGHLEQRGQSPSRIEREVSKECINLLNWVLEETEPDAYDDEEENTIPGVVATFAFNLDNPDSAAQFRIHAQAPQLHGVVFEVYHNLVRKMEWELERHPDADPIDVLRGLIEQLSEENPVILEP